MTSPTDPMPEQPDQRAPAPIDNPLPQWARRPKGGDEMTDLRLATFIGPAKWERTYKRKLAAFREDPTFVPTWNWSAFFATGLWFLYRKLYLAFVAFAVLPQLALLWITGTDQQLTVTTIMLPENRWLLLMSLAVELSTRIAAGGVANWLLFRRSRAAIRLVGMQALPEAESEQFLQRIGGVNRFGVAFVFVFTLVGVVATALA